MTVIRIPYIKEYLDKAGTVRRYFRKRGCKPVVLPGVPGSREFMGGLRGGDRHAAGTARAPWRPR
jgi:hypothetical protein